MTPQTTVQKHRLPRLPATSKAPKARPIPAWGGAPCMRTYNAPGLKARPIHNSIPQIPFIEFHTIFLKECAKFILKILLSMMRLLGIDVTNQGVQIRRPSREGTVASLPGKLRQFRRLGLKPFRSGRFKLLHHLRHFCRARQANREVNVVRNSTYAKAFTFGVAGNGSKIRVECRPNGRIEEGGTVLCAEDHMDQNKRERLRHRIDYRSGFQPSYSTANRTWGFTPCWYKGAPLALSRHPDDSPKKSIEGTLTALDLRQRTAEGSDSTFGLPQKSAKGAPLYQPGATPQAQGQTNGEGLKARPILHFAATLALCLLIPFIAIAQPTQPLHIKIINAKTNQPIPNERLNVALKTDQIGSVAMGTDKNGIILVNYGNATIIRILANMYADCRPRSELYTNYPIDTILKTGIITGNLCSDAKPRVHPGELILYEIPKTFIPVYPAPPLPPPPHSDENPHQPQK
jgi:hypothetical protein